MPGKLTSAGIGNLKRLGKFYDGTHGLFLQVYPTGAKCWQQRLTISGRRRTLGLGGFPAVGLADARAAACKNWLHVRDGGDSFAKPPKAAPTFEEAAATVIEQNAPTWTDPKHPKDWQNSLRRYAFPCLGQLLVCQLLVSHIEIHHVLEVLQPIWHTRRETARRVRQRIRAILDWAVTQRYRTDNPAGPAIHGVLPKRRSRDHQKRHHPAVPYSELPQLIVAARRKRSRLRLLFEFAVLTVVRSGEAREAQWSEFDFATATWFISGSRMNTGLPHRVPLSDRVLEILRELREVNAGAGLVFPGKKRGQPFSDSALLEFLGRLRLPGTEHVPATVHGFRSSFCDWVAETEAGTELAAERALAHASPSQTVAVYLRTDLLEVRRSLMQRWADHVTSAASA